MKKFMILSGLVLGVTLVASCGMTRLEMDYGTSHKLAKYNQILDPEAEKNMKPVTGLDGQAAQSVMDTYRKGFEKAPQTSTTYNFSIGSMGK